MNNPSEQSQPHQSVRPIQIARMFVYPWTEAANDPQLYVCVNGKPPTLAQLRFRGCECATGNRCFVAMYGELVAYTAEGDHDHSTAKPYTITLVDGSKYLPDQRWWSSSPAAINHHFPDLRITDVSAGWEEDEDYKPGWTGGYGMPIETAMGLLATHCPEWELAESDNRSLRWELRLKGHGFKRQDPKPYQALPAVQLHRN